MPKIKCNSINLFYEEFGQGEPLIFISGFTADHNVWMLVNQLFSQTHRVILFDNRGVGQSDVPDLPYTIEMMAEDTIRLCDALDIKKAIFIGNSMGGSIAQTLCHYYPDRVKAAVLSNTFIKIAAHYVLNASGWINLMKSNAPLEDIQKVRYALSFSSHFIEGDTFKLLFKTALNNPYPLTERGARQQFHALTHFDSSNWLQQIKTPCLVLGSDEDIICLPHKVNEITQQIPYARFHQFTQCGHLPLVEHPEEFHQVIMKFLNSIT